MDLRQTSNFKKLVDSHKWALAHFDQFGERGLIVRHHCEECGKEWTTLLLDRFEK